MYNPVKKQYTYDSYLITFSHGNLWLVDTKDRPAVMRGTLEACKGYVRKQKEYSVN